MSVSSSAMSSRVLVIAVRRSVPCASRVVEALAQGGMVLEGVRIRGAEFVEAPAELGQAARPGWRLGRWRGGPGDDRHIQRGLQGGRLLRGHLVGRLGQLVRIQAGDRCQPVDPDVADAGELDEDLLAQGIGPETGLQFRPLGGARSLVGGAQALAGRAGGSFRGTQPVPVLEVGRLQVADGSPGRRLGFGRGGQLGSHAVAFLAQAGFALVEGFEVTRRPSHALFAHRDAGFRPRSEVLGVAAGGIDDGQVRGQSIARRAQLGRAGLPHREGRAIRGIAGLGRRGVAIRGDRLARRDRLTVPCQFAGRPLDLRRVPRRFARHGLEVAGRASARIPPLAVARSSRPPRSGGQPRGPPVPPRPMWSLSSPRSSRSSRPLRVAPRPP